MQCFGMTMRQYYKAKAMAALIVGSAHETGYGKDYHSNNTNVAIAAGVVADAMLAEDAKHLEATP